MAKGVESICQEICLICTQLDKAFQPGSSVFVLREWTADCRRVFHLAPTKSGPLGGLFFVGLETEIYDCRCWMECRPLSTTMFSLPPRLNEPLSTSTQYLLSEDLHCVFRRSIAGQCVFERLFCLTPTLLMALNGETHTAFPRGCSQISTHDT